MRGGGRTIGEGFNPRHNSLNFIRLALILTVTLYHAALLGEFTGESYFNNTPTGALALYGFFGLSGFLITASALSNSAGRYLWKRFLRIVPAFWVCLVLTAFLFGTIVWARVAPAHCGLSCYVGFWKSGPFSYVYRNAYLKINQQFVSPRLFVLLLNTPLWTVFQEVLCYFLLLALSVAGFLHRRIWSVAVTVALWATVWVITLSPGGPKFFDATPYHYDDFLKLAPIFMVGALIYLYRDRIPDSGWLALISAGLFLATLWLPAGPKGAPQPQFYFSDSDLFLPLIVYPLLWLGIHLPLQKIGSRNDYSYGIYIYGWPVTQALLAWGAERWGYEAFLALVVLATLPFAVGSWWAIEKWALSLKKLELKDLTTLFRRRKPVSEVDW